MGAKAGTLSEAKYFKHTATLLNSYIFSPPHSLKQMYRVLPAPNNSSQSWLSIRKIWGAYKNPHTLAIS